MRPIDADALDEILKDLESRYKKSAFCLSAKVVANVRQIVYAMKTVDAVEVVHGRWGQDGAYNICSVCDRNVIMPHLHGLLLFKYCPYCGARMDGDENG